MAHNGIGSRTIGTHSIAGDPIALTGQEIELPSLGDVSTIGGVTVAPGQYRLLLPSLGDVATINGPNVFEYEVIPLPTAGGGPVVGGLWIQLAPEPEPTPTPGEPIPASLEGDDDRIVVRVVEEDDPASVLVTLDHPLAPQ